MNFDYYIILLIIFSYFLFDVHFRVFTQYIFIFSLVIGSIKIVKFQTNIFYIIISYFLGYYLILKNNPLIYYFSFYFPIRKLFRCLLFYSLISYITESNDRKKEHYIKKILLYLKYHYFKFIFFNIILRLFEVYFNNHLFIYFYSKNYFLDLEEKYYICANIFNNEKYFLIGYFN